ncbi:MAG: hypothetical protein ABR544_08295 [Gammaproteobacteria bacterium]
MTAMLVGAILSGPAFAAEWTTTIGADTYLGPVGTIKFDDWGYTGPDGVGANDFQVGGGLDSSNIGQIQHVVTKQPDWAPPDAPTPTTMA